MVYLWCIYCCWFVLENVETYNQRYNITESSLILSMPGCPSAGLQYYEIDVFQKVNCGLVSFHPIYIYSRNVVPIHNYNLCLSLYLEDDFLNKTIRSNVLPFSVWCRLSYLCVGVGYINSFFIYKLTFPGYLVTCMLMLF